MVDERLVSRLVKAIKEKYGEQRHNEWIYERRRVGAYVRGCLRSETLHGLYTFDPPTCIGVGGGGIVLRVTDRALDVPRAFKFPRPRRHQHIRAVELIRDEEALLKTLHHPNLIPMFWRGEVSVALSEGTIPAYVMHYIDSANSLDDFFQRPSTTASDFADLFRQAMSCVQYLHQRSVLHLDLKPANILVSPDKHLFVTDLGFAKDLTAIVETETKAGFTLRYAHPELQEQVSRMYDSNAAGARIKTSQLRKAFDLYALGGSFVEVLTLCGFLAERIDRKDKALIGLRRHLVLIAQRLLDGHALPQAFVHGGIDFDFNQHTLQFLRYGSAEEARIDLEKAMGLNCPDDMIDELNEFSSHTIRIAATGRTPLSKRVKAVIEHPAMSRLGQVSQLGLVNLVYPSATHSRLEHCIGTFANTCRYLLALYHDAENPFFRSLVSLDDIRLTMLAALLHDIGQYPMAHDLSEAHSRFEHEAYGPALLGAAPHEATLSALIRSQWNLDPTDVLRLIAPQPDALDFKERLLRGILDGPIDADKLDYLRRDSLHAGVVYGKGIDLDRAIGELTVVLRKDNGNDTADIGISEKGLVAAESIGVARYAMFSTVYWHHTSRALKAMLRQAVLDVLRQQDVGPDEMPSAEAIDRLLNPPESELLNPPTRQQQFWREFITAAFGPFIRLPEQPSLDLSPNGSPATPPADPHSNGGRLFDPLLNTPHTLSQIADSDTQLLLWFRSKASDAGKMLIDCLLSRNLYKRVYTRSGDSTNVARWKAFRDEITDVTRHRYESFRSTFQEKLFVAAAIHADPDWLRQQPLVLVDAPWLRRPDEPLLFSREGTFGTGTPATSVLWSSLHDSFEAAVAKIRVFVHPDYLDRLATLPRHLIETELGAASRSAPL